MTGPVPLAHQHRARPDPIIIGLRQVLAALHLWACGDAIQEPQRGGIEIAISLGLEAVGEEPQQQAFAQMWRGSPPCQTPPSRLQILETEITQLRDLGRKSVFSIKRHRAA